MLVLPDCAEPSSAGELSPTHTTRPLPYTADAHRTPVVLVCARPFIHTSPRTVALTAGYNVIVVPLWKASPVTLPIEPRVIESLATARTFS